MIYGLYLSATGVLANSYRQDGIANNLANSETVGFKRHVATFQLRPPESQAEHRPDLSNPTLDNIGGGFLASPTQIDMSQGELETTGGNLDAAIYGKGFFAVNDQGKTKLTRAGSFMLDNNGNLVMANGEGQQVLDQDGKPIQLDVNNAARLEIQKDGTITQQGQPIAKIGLFDVPDQSQLVKTGENLMDYPDLSNSLQASDATVQGGSTERANVDPTTELTQLMETQRQLEANANMIRYQDQSLNTLVNSVGKVS